MGTEMSVEAERAAFEAWASNIDHGYASFNGTRAPGNWYYFENDAQAAWAAWQASAARRAAQPADVGAGELPPLPEPKYAADDLADIYTADQMKEYARDAITHKAAPAQPSAAPIYQVEQQNGDWCDSPRDFWERMPMERRRIVYAATTSDQQAGAVARDWIEDATHENGNYQNVCSGCGNTFIGHKRRIVCKSCAAPAAIEQAGAPIDVAAIRDIADELSLEASNYEGDFADTVNGCADALNHIVEQAGAQPVAQADLDALDAKRYRWLRDPRNTESSSYVAVYGCTQLDTAIDAAMAATPVTDQAATKQENQK